MTMRKTSGQQRRELGSLAISIAVHAGVALALSVSWRWHPAPKPTPVEIALVRLPAPSAPIDGRSQPLELDASSSRPPTDRVIPDGPVSRVWRKKRPRGPVVTYSVRLSRAGWKPLEQKTFASAAVVRADEAAVLPPRQSCGARAPQPKTAPATWGSSRLRIATIQERIDAVTPLVHRTTKDCVHVGGLVRVRFRMNQRGYPLVHQIIQSSGNACLDDQVDTVLHLAEPYPYVADWVPVLVRFTL